MITRSLAARTDVALAVAVLGILGVMLVPLPPLLLDLLLTSNLALSLMTLLIGMYILRPLDFSLFPSLLLILTLFRLSLNVASTRLILLHGNDGTQAAGEVIHAFGRFVVGGNYVVGAVVFLILVVIQFVVITKGAGRIAEVAARFTLDAMPGKQLAIDADLNAGLITDAEARGRRREIAREADFYGAMDGASKFVRGDAVAGIIITAVNIVGGIGHRRSPASHGVCRGPEDLHAPHHRRRAGDPDPRPHRLHGGGPRGHPGGVGKRTGGCGDAAVRGTPSRAADHGRYAADPRNDPGSSQGPLPADGRRHRDRGVQRTQGAERWRGPAGHAGAGARDRAGEGREAPGARSAGVGGRVQPHPVGGSGAGRRSVRSRPVGPTPVRRPIWLQSFRLSDSGQPPAETRRIRHQSTRTRGGAGRDLGRAFWP